MFLQDSQQQLTDEVAEAADYERYNVHYEPL